MNKKYLHLILIIVLSLISYYVGSTILFLAYTSLFHITDVYKSYYAAVSSAIGYVAILIPVCTYIAIQEVKKR